MFLRHPWVKSFALLLAGTLILPGAATAQRQADVDAVNRLIDLYGATEDAMDITAQARLMAADRVLISQRVAGPIRRRTCGSSRRRMTHSRSRCPGSRCSPRIATG